MPKFRILLPLVCLTIAAFFMSACVKSSPSTTTTTPVQFVQTASVTADASGSNQSFSAAFNNQVTAGNAIVVVFWWYHPIGGSGIQSVSDDEGNIYQLGLDYSTDIAAGEQADVVYYYASNVKGGTPASITVATNETSDTTEISLVLLEYSGVSSVDAYSTQSVTSGSGSTAQIDTGTVTTHSAPEVILGSLLVTYNTPIAKAGGFTTRYSSSYFIVEDELATSTGSYDAQFSVPQPWPQYLISIPTMITLH